MNARDVTQALKDLGIELARTHGATPETVAACHLGLGIVMLRELHYSVDDLLALVKRIADQLEPN